mgnify:CR=1 FL=1
MRAITPARTAAPIASLPAWVQNWASVGGLISIQDLNSNGVRESGEDNLGGGDRSNAQYAVLGLHAAGRVGVKVPADVWRRAAEGDFVGLFSHCQRAVAEMVRQGRGSIINIASVSAELPLSRVFTYSASKAAVLNLTRNLGREWAPQGLDIIRMEWVGSIRYPESVLAATSPYVSAVFPETCRYVPGRSWAGATSYETAKSSDVSP